MGLEPRGLAALAALLLASAPLPAGAATFMVNSTADATDGSCGAGAGECTLREAIEAAVATPGRDTIGFDPAVFVLGTVTSINLLTPLPFVADPAGTAVDGSGSSVVINGDPALEDGIVFTSAPGVALADVAVTRLRFGSFPGHALRICGGGPPACDGDVSNATVARVTAVANGSDGIRIEGRVVSGVRVVDSVVHSSGMVGIHLAASQALLGARVESCTARLNGFDGVLLDGGPRNEASSIVRSAAVQNTGRGFDVRGDVVVGAELAELVSVANGNDGVQVFAESTVTSVAIADSVAAENAGNGFEVLGATGHTGTSLRGVEADGNTPHGITLVGPVEKARLERAVAIENADGGIALLESATKVKLSDVVALGNVSGVYLRGTRSSARRILAGANDDVGIFILENGSRNSVKQSTAPANNTGILIREPSTGNRVRKNSALGNVFADLFDQHVGCDGNRWRKNVFRSAVDPCIR